jgi:hypothetical protein
MTEPDFAHRIREAAAGRTLPELSAPPPQAFKAPPEPTAAAVVQGIRLAPAERLTALAAVRDGHKATARSANDRMHEAREAITERQRRIRLLASHGDDPPAHVASQIAALEAEVAALQQQRSAAYSEAETSAASAAQADRLLKSCLSLCARSQIVVPVLLASEVHHA